MSTDDPGSNAGPDCSLASEHEAAFRRAVLLAVSDVVYIVDLRTERCVWPTSMLVGVLGWTEAQLLNMGSDLEARVFHPDDLPAIHAANDEVGGLADNGVLETRFRVRYADGTYRWLVRRLTPFQRDAAGALTHALGAARDVTDAVALDERLTQAARHDALTGLANRSLFIDRLESALLREGPAQDVVPVLFCDLDGFKQVNDTSGHRAGDEVLLQVAERLLSTVRPQDTVARVGGDEFVIMLDPHRQRPQDIREETLAVIARLIAAVGEPVSISDDAGVAAECAVSVSVGVTFATLGSDPEDVVRQADSAMYRAKASGNGRYQIFDSGFRAEVVERGHIERTLRAALGVGPGGPGGSAMGAALSVVYQPLFDLSTMRLTGVEVLARLLDGFGLAWPPDSFIPIAEETGLIGPLGRLVLELACQDLARWQAEFPAWRDLGIAVNVSARQAGFPDLVDDVRAALRRSGLAAGALTLEITESVLLEADRSAVLALTTLHDEGVQISIDDFGTGYASLRYLAQLPVSSVKVDQSFTAGLPDDPTCVTIVRAVAALARDLGLTCVVEGIETGAQLRALPDGVHGQGFLLGRPLAADGFSELLSWLPALAPAASTGVVSRVPATTRWRPSKAPTGSWLAARTRRPDRSADQREATANRRDRTADRRERLADRRDAVADQRDQRDPVVSGSATSRLSTWDSTARQSRTLAAADRLAAQGDRVEEHLDREQARKRRADGQ